jgi:hypothetical protein
MHSLALVSMIFNHFRKVFDILCTEYRPIIMIIELKAKQVSLLGVKQTPKVEKKAKYK